MRIAVINLQCTVSGADPGIQVRGGGGGGGAHLKKIVPSGGRCKIVWGI